MVNEYSAWEGHLTGKTVWVLGSGKTLEYVPESFWNDKHVVAVNYAADMRNIDYCWNVTNHWDDAQELALKHPDYMIVTPDREMQPVAYMTGVDLSPLDNVIQVPTVDQPYGKFCTADHWPDDPDVFALGPTSAHLALAWAEYLGASSIILAGVDCGSIDGAGRVTNYPTNPDGTPGHLHYGLWETMLRDIAQHLRSKGTAVMSLNPWVTLSLEGHSFAQ